MTMYYDEESNNYYCTSDDVPRPASFDEAVSKARVVASALDTALYGIQACRMEKDVAQLVCRAVESAYALRRALEQADLKAKTNAVNKVVSMAQFMQYRNTYGKA